MRELPDGRLEVFTFKEGLLSRVAHDLMLVMDRFTIRTDGERVEARFYPESLRVAGVMQDGKLDRSLPSARDRDEIVDNVRFKILEIDRHSQATLEATVRDHGGHRTLDAMLTLHGRSAPLEVEVRERASMWEGEIELRPSEFGIMPFKALLGAIKLRDLVRVRFQVPIIPL